MTSRSAAGANGTHGVWSSGLPIRLVGTGGRATAAAAACPRESDAGARDIGAAMVGVACIWCACSARAAR